MGEKNSVVLLLGWPHVAPSIEEAQMVARGEVIDQMAQLAERHVAEQQDAGDVIEDHDGCASGEEQVE